MSWIGLRDKAGTAQFRATGLVGELQNSGRHAPDTFIPRGTLLLEFDHEPDGRRRNLLRFSASAPWHSSLRLSLDTDGTLRLMMSQGASSVSYALPTPLGSHKGKAVVWYTWDGPARRGTLAVRACTGDQYQTDLIGPMPLCYRDADRIITHPRLSEIDSSTVFLALSDRVEPVGMPATLSGDALVETPAGHVRLDMLRPGAAVVTANGDVAQVRSIEPQILPARGCFAPVIIRAPYYGAYRDLRISPFQNIELGGSKIEYLFDQEHVLARVGHLADGREIISAGGPDLVCYYHILLDHHDILCLSGVRLPSLSFAEFRQDPVRIRTGILRGLPTELMPEGPALKTPNLRDFEALLIPIR